MCRRARNQYSRHGRPDRRLRIVDAARPDDVVESRSTRTSARRRPWSTIPSRSPANCRYFSGDLRGADIAFASDIPIAAGVSTRAHWSSHLSWHCSCQFADARPWSDSPLTWVPSRADTRSATLPATAASERSAEAKTTPRFCARGECPRQYSFCPVRFEREVPLPRDHELVIASSGVVARRSRRSRAVQRAVRRTQRIAERWARSPAGTMRRLVIS